MVTTAQVPYRLIPRDGAVQPLIDLCRRRRWPLVAVDDADEMINAPFILCFAVPGRDTNVELLDDPRSGVIHIAVTGGARDEVVDELRRELDLESLAEALHAHDFADGPAALVRALLRLAVAAPPEPDGQVIARIHTALADSRPAIRCTGLLAVLFRPWAAFYDRVREIADEDDDPACRGDAQLLLSEWDRFSIEAP